MVPNPNEYSKNINWKLSWINPLPCRRILDQLEAKKIDEKGAKFQEMKCFFFLDTEEILGEKGTMACNKQLVWCPLSLNVIFQNL